MTTTVEMAAREGRRKEGSEMPAVRHNLTDREVQLLRGVVDDKTYPQIAHDMGLSLETIKSYAARVRAKLGIYTKVGLAVWAVKNLKG